MYVYYGFTILFAFRMPVPDRGWGNAPVRVCDECFAFSQRSSTSSSSSTLSEAQRHLLESAVEDDAVVANGAGVPPQPGAATDASEKRKLEEGLRAFRQRSTAAPTSDSTAPSVTPRAIGEAFGGALSVVKSAFGYPIGAPRRDAPLLSPLRIFY